MCVDTVVPLLHRCGPTPSKRPYDFVYCFLECSWVSTLEPHHLAFSSNSPLPSSSPPSSYLPGKDACGPYCCMDNGEGRNLFQSGEHGRKGTGNTESFRLFTRGKTLNVILILPALKQRVRGSRAGKKSPSSLSSRALC